MVFVYLYTQKAYEVRQCSMSLYFAYGFVVCILVLIIMQLYYCKYTIISTAASVIFTCVFEYDWAWK